MREGTRERLEIFTFSTTQSNKSQESSTGGVSVPGTATISANRVVEYYGIASIPNDPDTVRIRTSGIISDEYIILFSVLGLIGSWWSIVSLIWPASLKTQSVIKSWLRLQPSQKELAHKMKLDSEFKIELTMKEIKEHRDAEIARSCELVRRIIVPLLDEFNSGKLSKGQTYILLSKSRLISEDEINSALNVKNKDEALAC